MTNDERIAVINECIATIHAAVKKGLPPMQELEALKAQGDLEYVEPEEPADPGPEEYVTEGDDEEEPSDDGADDGEDEEAVEDELRELEARANAEPEETPAPKRGRGRAK